MTVFLDILVLFAVFCVSAAWYYYLSQTKIRRFYQTVPGPKTVPILGNALDFKSKTRGILNTFLNYTNNYGGVVKIQIGPFKRQLLVTDYKFLEFILSSTRVINKSQIYRNMRPWLGTGLLTSEGMKWKKHRRIITPTFHFKILEQFLTAFESAGDILIEKLKQGVGKDSIDIYPFITLCALDVICETAMGTTVNAQEYTESEYVRSVKEMGRILMERVITPLKSSNLVFKLSDDYRIQKKALQILHDYTNDVINRRRKELEKERNSTTKKAGEDFGIKKKMAFLDLLLEAQVDGQPLSHEDIREEVDTFMFEGHDTTASAISFALYSIANNPEVQDKVLKEQQEIFGDDDKNPEITYTSLQNMKYLELVIKETLRLYPSVPFYGRETDQDVEYGGQIIPKGVAITIFAYGIHRNPHYFPNPDKFDPGRFENMDGKVPYAYIPFSAGPRNCIGQKFAMLEMKSTISKIIRNYELSPAMPHHTLELVAETVIKSANGVCVSLRPRI